MSDVKALEGLMVVSIEQAVAAPLCTARLSDAGARVIKVERAAGDFGRGYDTAAKGDSSYFAWINHGKESIVLDFKQEGDAGLLQKLIAQADVLVQNLAPGALARSGFDSDLLRERHPRLVTCSISGYGNGQAVAGMKAYDLLVQAETGLISISGGPGEHGRIGVSLCDIGAGVTAYTGILEALLRRTITGKGGHVDVSLFGVTAEWMTVPFLHTENGAAAPTRSGLKHPSIAPYGAFADASGTLTLISIQNEREWKRLCVDALDCPALYENPQFSSNDLRVAHRPELDQAIENITRLHSTQALRASLQKASIAFGGLNSVTDLLDHAALNRRTIRNSLGADVSMPANPVQHRSSVSAMTADESDAQAGIGDTAAPQVPVLNEHGDALREEFGGDSTI